MVFCGQFLIEVSGWCAHCTVGLIKSYDFECEWHQKESPGSQYMRIFSEEYLQNGINGDCSLSNCVLTCLMSDNNVA